MNKIKILYAMGGNMHRAGAETMIMNYVRYLSKYNEFDINILVHGFEKGDFDDELKSLGVSVIPVPIRSKDLWNYKNKVKKVLINGKYDIVHCNMDASSGDFLEIAKKCGIPIRIAHSHITAYQAKNILKRLNSMLSKRKISKVATDYMACSKMAGDWMFKNKEYTLVNNAICIDDYKPNVEIRIKMREELGIPSDTTVLGHIGRFHFQKNHEGLLKIFKEYHDLNKNAILLCAGDGELLSSIKELAINYEIFENIIFLGVRSDIARLMQAMDVFLLPSLFEGLPVVGIEAQAAGLPCLFSDAVTNEICILENSKRLPLEEVDVWVNEIDRVKSNRINDVSPLIDAGYSIKREAEKLKDYYCNSYSKCINNS